MAKSFGNNVTFLALFCLCFLLLSPTEVKAAEAKDCSCKRYSQTWTGPCVSSLLCDNKCRKKEGARYGACHTDKHGVACFCYFKC